MPANTIRRTRLKAVSIKCSVHIFLEEEGRELLAMVSVRLVGLAWSVHCACTSESESFGLKSEFTGGSWLGKHAKDDEES